MLAKAAAALSALTVFVSYDSNGQDGFERFSESGAWIAKGLGLPFTFAPTACQFWPVFERDAELRRGFPLRETLSERVKLAGVSTSGGVSAALMEQNAPL